MSAPPAFAPVDPDRHQVWDRWVEATGGRIQQCTWWLAPLAPFGVRHEVVAAFEGDAPVAGALLRSTQLPGVGASLVDCIHGPVTEAWSQAHADAFVAAVAQVARRHRALSVTFREVGDPVVHRSLVDALERRRAPWVVGPAERRAVVPLTGRDIDQVAAAFGSSVRWSVRKARRGPLEVRSLRTADELSAAYGAFRASADRKGFMELRPRAALEPVMAACVASDAGLVLGAVDPEGEVVAAVFVSMLGPEPEYLYGGFHLEHRALRPNPMLHHEAMARALARGKVGYDLGYLSGKAAEAGMNDFKHSFGAETRDAPEAIEWLLRPRLARALAAARRQRWAKGVIRRVRAQVERRGEGAASPR